MQIRFCIMYSYLFLHGHIHQKGIRSKTGSLLLLAAGLALDLCPLCPWDYEAISHSLSLIVLQMVQQILLGMGKMLAQLMFRFNHASLFDGITDADVLGKHDLTGNVEVLVSCCQNADLTPDGVADSVKA